jgi:hypothetical protein
LSKASQKLADPEETDDCMTTHEESENDELGWEALSFKALTDTILLVSCFRHSGAASEDHAPAQAVRDGSHWRVIEYEFSITVYMFVSEQCMARPLLSCVTPLSRAKKGH